jgi:hypothetical protein
MTPPVPRGLTEAEQAFAIALEWRVSRLAALAIAAGGGGRDSHGQPVPGLSDRLARVHLDLADLARWAAAQRGGTP